MNAPTPMIEWTRPKLREFKRAFEEARDAQRDPTDDTFEFDGHLFVLGYAKYLIEYLEVQLL